MTQERQDFLDKVRNCRFKTAELKPEYLSNLEKQDGDIYVQIANSFVDSHGEAQFVVAHGDFGYSVHSEDKFCNFIL